MTEELYLLLQNKENALSFNNQIMDLNRTIDLIISDLEKAIEIIDDLKNYQGVPELQIEIAKSKCSQAASLIALLKNKQEAAQAKITVDPVVGIKGTEMKQPEAPAIKSEEKVRSEPVREKNKLEKKPAITEPLSKEPRVIIADKFDENPESLHSKLGGLLDKDSVPDYLKVSRAANLRQVIGINDRFLFIRELFNGNNEEYEKAISRIDDSVGIDDATNLFREYTGSRWNNEAGKQFLDLLKRKFPANE
jgi:hypothetical protein